MSITPELYAKQRDALVEELRRVSSSIKRLRSEDADLDLSELELKEKEIAAITRRVYENQFKFVLIAQSQGGKSTTFNAMSGGMVLSPMGNAALKCSAAPIVQMNVTEDRDVGAYVYLRSDSDLNDICAELLGSILSGRRINIRDASSLRASREEHGRRLEEWLRNPKSVSDEQRDLLFSVGLILTFFDSPEVQRLYRQTGPSANEPLRLPVADAGQMARFPADFIRRYATGDPRAFAASEVYFPFINRIVCKIKSDNLSRIGASVTDSPGLFANNTDTRIAMQEIRDADAVWYLLDAKQVSEYERYAIRECSVICGDRIFFSANIKGNFASRDYVLKNIIPAMAAGLRASGARVGDDEIYPYHALLALLAMQAPLILNNRVDPTITEFLRQMCEVRDMQVDSPAEAWALLAGDMLRNLSRTVERQFSALPQPLSPAGIEIVRRESGLDQILQRIEEYVVSRKGSTILIDRGASRAVALLQIVEQRLATRELLAGKSVEESKQKFEDTGRKLDEVQEFAGKMLNPIIDSAGEIVDKELAADLLDRILIPRMKDVAEASASELRQVLTAAGILEGGWNWLTGDGPTTAGRCRTILESILQKQMILSVAGWSGQLQERKNELFNRRVLDHATWLSGEIRKKWAATIGDDELLGALPEPTGFQVDLIFDASTIENAIEDTHLVAKTILEIFKAVIIAILTVFFNWELAFLPFELLDESVAKAATDGLTKQLQSKLQSKREDLIAELARMVAPYRESCIKAILAPLKDVEASFNADRAQAARDWDRDLAEQQRIAEKSKKAREEHIEPLRKGLQDYVEETSRLCGLRN